MMSIEKLMRLNFVRLNSWRVEKINVRNRKLTRRLLVLCSNKWRLKNFHFNVSLYSTLLVYYTFTLHYIIRGFRFRNGLCTHVLYTIHDTDRACVKHKCSQHSLLFLELVDRSYRVDRRRCARRQRRRQSPSARRPRRRPPGTVSTSR